MPELPEVEVVRLTLERRLPGRRVRDFDLHCADLRWPVQEAELAALRGRRFLTLRRRAKYLLIDAEGGHTLVVHLGMTGQLTVASASEEVVKHEHLALHLDDGRRLRFVDPRRFGTVFVAPTESVEEHPRLASLGPEPLGEHFTAQLLADKARGRRGSVKAFLMDGKVVVGVGNIYACEALWRARVHPRRSVARVSTATWERLVQEVRTVLADAIRQGGTTVSDFADGEGNAGYFQVSLSVYGREGEPCERCQRIVKREVLAGRGTFYCPGCQR